MRSGRSRGRGLAAGGHPPRPRRARHRRHGHRPGLPRRGRGANTRTGRGSQECPRGRRPDRLALHGCLRAGRRRTAGRAPRHHPLGPHRRPGRPPSRGPGRTRRALRRRGHRAHLGGQVGGDGPVPARRTHRPWRCGGEHARPHTGRTAPPAGRAGPVHPGTGVARHAPRHGTRPHGTAVLGDGPPRPTAHGHRPRPARGDEPAQPHPPLPRGHRHQPLQWLLVQRVNRAQELLERTDHGIDQVAASCGLGSGATLRRHFNRVLGVPPEAYRRTFREGLRP